MFPSISKEGAETQAHSKPLKSTPKRTGGAGSPASPPNSKSPKAQVEARHNERTIRSLCHHYFKETNSEQRRRKLTTREFDSQSNWLSIPKRSELYPKIVYPGYRQEDVLDCILEHVISLLVYKYKFERSLERKLGLIAKPSADLYLKRIYNLRTTQGRVVYPVSNPPLTLHEQNCLASHPLWASKQHSKRFHIPWKSSKENVLTVTDFYCPSKSSTLKLPEITTVPSLTSNLSSNSQLTSPRNSVQQIQSKTALPKI
ncbi:uncharacterized protein LOC115480910 [Microcaecilia unicolor]|uniref:Uncharacterized protein LOC115480910 n=1 Tax=Microcaecilia unicolor TaxID=1415580 RepID=A0A6P7ZP57_9AMPH|nr:uncharacterized protein LOC115480910 [Microcaecilia unicolor]